MTPDPLPPEVWAEEGQRAAEGLHDVAAAIVTGRDPLAAAQVAIGIAEAHARERRVAIADLVGNLPPLTPLDDQPGLLECLRDGESVSAIGQPLGDLDGVFVLPSGRGPIAERWVFESARWEKLVAGFREVDALLLIVAAPHSPGLNVLIERVDGVVAVDLPPSDVRSWPLLATVDHPAPELPPLIGEERLGALRGAGGGASKRGGNRRGQRAALAVVTLGLLAATVAVAVARYRAPESVEGILTPEDPDVGVAPAPPPPAEIVELDLGPFVNPADSVAPAQFAVELVAANTPESANSRLVALGAPYPAPTVAPVLLRAGGVLWYRALVGAWTDRGVAEAWLDDQRARGLVRPNVGRVVAVPVALQLSQVRGPDVEATLQQWQAQGVAAYALRQDDGTARILAGAFESVGQAAWLARELRELGASPQLAYRTGRMF